MQVGLELQEAIEKALAGFGFPKTVVHLEHPVDPSHGDYSTNIALVLAKKEKKNPQELAEEIVKGLGDMKKLRETVEKVEIAAPGFINFWLSREAFGKELEQALKDGERYGGGSFGTGRKILVEFAHPNTHKLFHIGHLRNITLGESVSRLLEFVDFDVVRANYQGDIGLHIAKAMVGIQKLMRDKNLSLNAITKWSSEDKIHFLGEGYVAGNLLYESDEMKKEVDEMNTLLYTGLSSFRPEEQEKIQNLYKETRKWSLEYFDKIYKRVGTKFDRLYFESEVAEPGRKLVLDNLGEVFRKDQGAVIFPGEDYSLHNRVFINSLGLPTYEAKDIGLAGLQLEEFSPDQLIHVVGPEQKGYFEVVFKAIELVFPKLAGREYHLLYGWVRLKTGKMSSRKGEVVEGEWLLDETKKRLKEKYEMPEDIAEKVAVGAVKYSMLRLHPASEIAFDIDESIRLDGDSGPGRLPTTAKSNLTTAVDSKQWTVGNLEPEELAILRHFYKFPEVVRESAEKFSPNILCNFLFELAQKYNAFYNKHRILDPEFVGARRHYSQVKLGYCGRP
ncbi:MAG: arginine--tRNA ligase [Candidatus Blackburnbacteria bacterium]|nr:arginine--tRNA ligase [Candidatus Blackburnbacteria bacterium]